MFIPWILLIKISPTLIKIARKTIAPRMPRKSKLCYYCLGILKDAKMIAITNRLSTLKDNSMI